MTNAVRAGAHYFAIIFAAGFLFGTIRTLLLATRLGETTAVLFELPIMLALSWIVCRWLARHFDVPKALTARLTMGFLAFALLMTAETALSIFGFGRTLAQHLASYHSTAAQLGLSAQIAFAAFPVIQGKLTRA